MYTVMQKKELVRRLYEEYWNKNNPDIPKDFFTNDFTLTDPYVPIPGTGLIAAKNHFEMFKKAFPDLTFAIEELIAEGDTVVARTFATATHEGEFLGIPATHVKATLPAVSFYRFEDGKIANVFVLWDIFGFFRAAGVFTPAGLDKPAFATR